MTAQQLPPDLKRALERFAIALLALAFLWAAQHATPDLWAWVTRPMHP